MTTKTKDKFRTSKQLGITPLTRKYLIYALKTLPTLSTPQKLNGGTFGFNMGVVSSTGPDFQGHPCGTAGCILGLMRYKARLDGVCDSYGQINEFECLEDGTVITKLDRLYYPTLTDGLDRITNVQAAEAVRGFLTKGKAHYGKLEYKKG